MNCVALILAAGKSTRLKAGGIQTPKSLLTLPDGETFLYRAVKNVKGIASPIAVLGHHSDEVSDYCGKHRIPYRLNESYESGQTSSLKAGLGALPAKAEFFFIYPVDYPAVRRETIAALIEAQRDSGKSIVIPVCDSRGGHPVLVSASLAVEFLALADGEPAYTVIRREPDRVLRFTVDDPGVLIDIDTAADYEALMSAASAPPFAAR